MTGLCSIPGLIKKTDKLKAERTSRGEAELFYRDVVLKHEGDDCLLWPYSHSGDGYGRIKIDGRMTNVTRLVCEDVNGPPPTPEHEAAHSCGKGHLACVTKRHLSWKTPKENQADRIIHGTHQYGERNRMAKLTEAKVREILSLKGIKSQREIASLFGVSSRAIRHIHNGERWSWLMPPSLGAKPLSDEPEPQQ